MAATRRDALKLLAAAMLAAPAAARAADLPSQITVDWAYYNPVSLVLKEKGWLEDDLKPLGVGVRWVQSLGSNKALEFLNAGSLDIGSSAGAPPPPAPPHPHPGKAGYGYNQPARAPPPPPPHTR